MKPLPVLAFFLLWFFSCQSENPSQRMVEESEPANTPELLQQWNNAWNRNDVESIQGLIAENAVFLLHGEQYSAEALYSWMSANAAAVKELYTEALQSSSCGNMAYVSGTYQHGIQEHDSQQLRGTFTFVWERQQKNEWKIKVLDISGSTEWERLEDNEWKINKINQ
jgi:ketosteroid isomerase-like protein